ncbi:hypothetical protein CEXT_368651 [Caerostris extrusa]|uniref:Uncharacterized protein n=1 Tax=Caerostris extrusa TaxID=172846 RepID=A0AAV4N8H8_CAEEX|nr:hypothetical protein CEXT_368651 [Caerostris extrusa]
MFDGNCKLHTQLADSLVLFGKMHDITLLFMAVSGRQWLLVLRPLLSAVAGIQTSTTRLPSSLEDFTERDID